MLEREPVKREDGGIQKKNLGHGGRRGSSMGAQRNSDRHGRKELKRGGQAKST